MAYTFDGELHPASKDRFSTEDGDQGAKHFTIYEPSNTHSTVLHWIYVTPTPRISRGVTRETGGIEDTSTIATRTSFDQRLLWRQWLSVAPIAARASADP